MIGIISGLLLFPVAGPVKGLQWLAGRVLDEAEDALFNEDRIYSEFVELGMRHAAGKISDAEFAEQEELLLNRLASVREYREGLFDGSGVEQTADEIPC